MFYAAHGIPSQSQPLHFHAKLLGSDGVDLDKSGCKELREGSVVLEAHEEELKCDPQRSLFGYED
jgi:hypothetical protein